MTVTLVGRKHADGSKNYDVRIFDGEAEEGYVEIFVPCTTKRGAERLLDSLEENGMGVSRGDDVNISY